jgi:1-acyl-sn-glycerol-3-phosphate acyltransferase
MSGEDNIPLDKPVLLALNHPNSFLDAVIVGGHLSRETHFLARGDAFGNKYVRGILHSLNMLPIYRLSEGKENLGKNNETFDACQTILSQGKMVILFAEGLSINNWDLRPMRKGLARLALKAWQSEGLASELQVVPVGLTYEHYKGEGKAVLINIGKPILKSELNIEGNEALFVKEFNQRVFDGLSQLIPVMPEMVEGSETHEKFRGIMQTSATYNEEASAVLKDILSGKQSPTKANNTKKIQNSIVFWPLYAFSKWMAEKLFKQSLFHDSVIFGFILFLWPVYLLLLWKFIGFLFS